MLSLRWFLTLCLSHFSSSSSHTHVAFKCWIVWIIILTGGNCHQVLWYHPYVVDVWLLANLYQLPPFGLRLVHPYIYITFTYPCRAWAKGFVPCQPTSNNFYEFYHWQLKYFHRKIPVWIPLCDLNNFSIPNLIPYFSSRLSDL